MPRQTPEAQQRRIADLPLNVPRLIADLAQCLEFVIRHQCHRVSDFGYAEALPTKKANLRINAPRGSR